MEHEKQDLGIVCLRYYQRAVAVLEKELRFLTTSTEML